MSNKTKLNQVLTDEERMDSLWQLLVENPNPVENKYIVEIVDQGISYIPYFSGATNQLDALYQASSDYFALHSHAGVSDLWVTALFEDCGDEDSDQTRTNLHFRTFPVPD